MRLGDLTLTLVDDGRFGLDGGAMFGVVPRTLWAQKKPPDEANRIRMTTNCLLVERGDDLLLVDTGVGDKGDEKFERLFAVDTTVPRLPEQIAAAGYEPGDVTHVVLTHLHFDHCGWNTVRRGDGWRPTFPNARYWLARGEVEHARAPNARDRSSYDPRNFEPLFAAGVVELFDDAAAPIAGVRAVRVPGHNRDMCIVLVEAAEGTLAFWADLVPTAAHVPPAWIMSYDLFPMETLANKQHWLPQAADGGWWCVFEHDPDIPFGRVVRDARGRLVAEPLDAALIRPG